MTTMYKRGNIEYLSQKHYKNSLVKFSQEMHETTVGMVLGEATIYKKNNTSEAYVKIEHGPGQEAFVEHLFHLYYPFCFMAKPQRRFVKAGPRAGQLHSFYFYTFSHSSFTSVWNIMRRVIEVEGKRLCKSISNDFIERYCSGRTLAYWIMCDGELQCRGKMMWLPTESFARKDVENLSNQLKKKTSLLFTQSWCNVNQDIKKQLHLQEAQVFLLKNSIAQARLRSVIV